MTQEKVIRLTVLYTDAGCIERVVAVFRKLLIDVNWIWGRRIDSHYEMYVSVKDHQNLKLALLNLSKTVGVESVELLLDAKVKRYVYTNGKFEKVAEESPANESINIGFRQFVVYIPVYTRIAGYRWGEKYGENI
ncbi:MAG: hypothetical protein N3D82_00245 [Ignisphaera sp.]|nr:hypothetical protein [Ignisphaera sp.]MCX8167446.1 hypothetical protein [Ignisphaera sp.]MDW8084690.1 hypothetical protein [Ignisphaera sp.]